MRLRTFILACTLMGATAFSAAAAQMSEAEIYAQKCSKCHGDHAEGNPAKKAPALNNKCKGDLLVGILDLQGSLTLTGSSSGKHEDMEHNLKKLEELGYHVDARKMAQYIYTTFNPSAKK